MRGLFLYVYFYYICVSNAKFMKTTIQYIASIIMLIITPLAFLFWKGDCKWTWEALYALIPVTIMSIGILGADKKEVNSKCVANLYAFEVVFPYVWVGVCSMFGLLPMHTIICFLTIAVALGCATTMKYSVGQGATLLKDLKTRTSTLQLQFSTLLCIALVAARFI